MTELRLYILPTALLEAYTARIEASLAQTFGELKDNELSIASFDFYVSVSAVFSSKIEGEPIEMDSFIKHKRMGVSYQPDYTRKTDDLYDAYIFAQQHLLSRENILKAHKMLTKHILHETSQGAIRKGNMYVIAEDGKTAYLAVSPDKVADEMEKFYADLDSLLKTDLSFQEIFFFASLIHLVFVKIHPFEDGNGRTARLLEKWFLAQKLGAKAWFIESEKYYYSQHQLYYTNIRKLGLEYDFLDYTKALPFLQMLPQSLAVNKI